jgi:hypothetical protein
MAVRKGTYESVSVFYFHAVRPSLMSCGGVGEELLLAGCNPLS